MHLSGKTGLFYRSKEQICSYGKGDLRIAFVQWTLFYITVSAQLKAAPICSENTDYCRDLPFVTL
jgi:hypothetical protein